MILKFSFYFLMVLFYAGHSVAADKDITIAPMSVIGLGDVAPTNKSITIKEMNVVGIGTPETVNKSITIPAMNVVGVGAQPAAVQKSILIGSMNVVGAADTTTVSGPGLMPSPTLSPSPVPAPSPSLAPPATPTMSGSTFSNPTRIGIQPVKRPGLIVPVRPVQVPAPQGPALSRPQTVTSPANTVSSTTESAPTVRPLLKSPIRLQPVTAPSASGTQKVIIPNR